MKHRHFLGQILSDKDYFVDEEIDYIRYHSRRFYYTYKQCRKYLRSGMKVLSVGAGLACIEKMLIRLGVEVTVVDFPAAIHQNRSYYKHLGIHTCAADFMSHPIDLPENEFDFLLCSEVIEHIPMAPLDQLQKIRPLLKPSAVAIITTPNMGSILHIGRLLLMQPIMEDPSRTFGEVNAANQAIHRREYLPREIETSYRQAGFNPIGKKFFFYTQKPSISLLLLLLVGLPIPRFRQGMLLVAQKGG